MQTVYTAILPTSNASLPKSAAPPASSTNQRSRADLDRLDRGRSSTTANISPSPLTPPIHPPWPPPSDPHFCARSWQRQRNAHTRHPPSDPNSMRKHDRHGPRNEQPSRLQRNDQSSHLCLRSSTAASMTLLKCPSHTHHTEVITGAWRGGHCI